MNGKISNQVFDKIKQEKIKMRPGYYFRFVFAFWKILSAAVLVIASVILSLVFYESSILSHSFTLAYILLTLMLVYLASRFYRNSMLCCRYEDYTLLGAMLVIVILLSMAFYSFGQTKPLHDRIEMKVEQRSTIIFP